MSEYSPPRYRLDYEGELLVALQEDTFATLMTIQTNIVRTEQYFALCAAAELLIPDAITDYEQYMQIAFVNAGAIACAGFVESDVEAPLKHSTISNLGMRYVPIRILSNNHEEQFMAFNELAKKGNEAHSDFKAHFWLVANHYANMLPDSNIVEFVQMGMGYTLYQIDQALLRAIIAYSTQEATRADWSQPLSWHVD